MSTTSISLVCSDPKETALNAEALSRLLSKIDPEVLAEEIDIVGELLAAIAEAAGTVASSIKYKEPKPARPPKRTAQSANGAADTYDQAAGWNLVKPIQAIPA